MQALLLMEEARGLFHKAVIMSGLAQRLENSRGSF